MASIEQLSTALINADRAGDVQAARTLAAEISRMRGGPEPEAKNGFMERANALTGSMVDNVPIIGPYIKSGTEKAAAGVRSLMSGAPYADELEAVRNYNKANVERNPGTALAGSIAGGVGGTIPAIMAAPAAFGAGAGSMMARSGASMVSGGLINSADSAVRSNGDLQSTVIGGGVGAGLGLVTPGVAAGIGKGLTALSDRLFGLSKASGPIAGIPKPAVNYALNTMSDPATQATMQAELQRLGPQAMLADVSQEWQGVARGAASRPGMRDEILNPLLNRDAAKNIRLRDDMNTSLGPSRVPSQVQREIEAGQSNLGPQYTEVFNGARAVDTTRIAERLDAEAINLRGPAQRAVRQVRQMLNIAGEGDILDPSPYTLFQTRQAIDGLLSSEINPKVVSVLTHARRQVDDTLAQAVPGIKNVDGRFAELANQNTALSRGQQVLESGRTAPRPQELADEVSQGAIPQGRMIGPSAVPFRLKEGARAEMERVVGTNANDPAAMQRLVKSEGDWNRDRLRTLFGPKADDALGAIDRETTFYRTTNKIASGSDTAMANRFGQFLDDTARPNSIPVAASTPGLVARGVQKVVQSMLGANAEANAEKFAKDLGKLAVAQGASRDEIVQALLSAATKRQSLQPVSEGVEKVARLLMTGARPSASQQLQGR